MPILIEILDQLRERAIRMRAAASFSILCFLGSFLARSWAHSIVRSAAEVLEIHRGFEAVSIGYAGFGSLLISLVERDGVVMVKKLVISRDREILQRDFSSPSGYRYPNTRLTRVEIEMPLGDFQVKTEVLLNSWVLAAVAGGSAAATLGWIALVAWIRLRGRRSVEIAVARGMAAQARQVAHDIRSPLAALDEALAADARFRDNQLVVSSVERIREIAEDLLARPRGQSEAQAVPQPVSPLIEQVVREKEALVRGKQGVRIVLKIAEDASSAAGLLDPAQFKRALSNLIDNAVEAVAAGGVVTVALVRAGGFLTISVRDTGAGIAPEILAQLGRPGATFGKKSGSGLGLSHARASVESWGGRLEIVSEPARGTVVSLHVPLAAAALIDDDPLARRTWELAALRSGVALRTFGSVEEFLDGCDGFPPGAPIYVDSELSNGMRGEVESLKIAARGFANIHLATGHEVASLPAHVRGAVGKNPPWTAR